MLFRCDARSLRLLVRCVSARATTAAVEEVQEMPLDVAAVPAPATQAATVPPLTVSTLLTSWTWDSAAVVLAVILSAAYVLAVRLSLIHISEPTRLLSISYAVFCLKK